MGREPENYMGAGDVGPHTDYEDEAWEAGYLAALRYAFFLTCDEQIKHQIEVAEINFATNNEGRYQD